MKWMFAAVFAAAIATLRPRASRRKAASRAPSSAAPPATWRDTASSAQRPVASSAITKPTSPIPTTRTPRRLRVRSEAMAKLMEGLVRRVAADSARPDWTLLAASELASAAIVLFFRSMFSV
jgi:hypothetical protein